MGQQLDRDCDGYARNDEVRNADDIKTLGLLSFVIASVAVAISAKDILGKL